MKSAFTLVELLVTVAIIGILAAIALPNFLEAQTRAKVSRAKADLATLATALESYAVDHNVYPVNSAGLGLTGELLNLTTPVSHLASLPRDPFTRSALYAYYAMAPQSGLEEEGFGRYVLASAGPDRLLQTTLGGTDEYDPTNGTSSGGDIIRSQSGRSQKGTRHQQ